MHADKGKALIKMWKKGYKGEELDQAWHDLQDRGLVWECREHTDCVQVFVKGERYLSASAGVDR